MIVEENYEIEYYTTDIQKHRSLYRNLFFDITIDPFRKRN